MKKLFFFGVCMTIAILSGRSQHLSPVLLSCAGSSDFSGKIQIDWSLGEANIMPVFHSDLLITQGFQQPYIQVIKSITNQELQNTAFTAFPNPANDYFIIQFEKNIDPDVEILLTDHSGQILTSPRFQTHESRLEFDIANLASGVYFLQLIQKNETPEIIRFIKIN